MTTSTPTTAQPAQQGQPSPADIIAALTPAQRMLLSMGLHPRATFAHKAPRKDHRMPRQVVPRARDALANAEAVVSSLVGAVAPAGEAQA